MNDEQRVAIEAGLNLCMFLRTGRLVKRCERGSDVHRPVKMWGSAVRLTYVLGIRAVRLRRNWPRASFEIAHFTTAFREIAAKIFTTARCILRVIVGFLPNSFTGMSPVSGNPVHF